MKILSADHEPTELYVEDTKVIRVHDPAGQYCGSLVSREGKLQFFPSPVSSDLPLDLNWSAAQFTADVDRNLGTIHHDGPLVYRLGKLWRTQSYAANYKVECLQQLDQHRDQNMSREQLLTSFLWPIQDPLVPEHDTVAMLAEALGNETYRIYTTFEPHGFRPEVKHPGELAPNSIRRIGAWDDKQMFLTRAQLVGNFSWYGGLPAGVALSWDTQHCFSVATEAILAWPF